MDGTVLVRITVRKYTWHEFVHDVCYVLYATLVISNALSKRFLHVSFRQILQGIRYVPAQISKVGLYGLVGVVGVAVMASMFWIPVVLFLAAIGKIQ